MKAAILNAISQRFEVVDLDIAAPRGREVQIQVKASGLCHSDLHLSQNDFGIPLPAVFGHELAGVVKAVGPDVREFEVGDHVVGSLIQFCGHCASCFRGRLFQCLHPEETLRPEQDEPRLNRSGAPVTQAFGIAAFAEEALMHENQLVKVPKALPFAQACILGCGTVTGAGAAINTANIRPGDTAVIIGVGGIGLNIISGARLAGAQRIIAIDMQPKKEVIARNFGATDFIDAHCDDTVAAVHSLLGGGADYVFEAIGLKSTSEQALKMTRLGGTVFMIGVHKPDTPIAVDVMTDLIFNQVTVKGVYMGSTNIKHDIPMYAEMYLQGRLNLDDLVSQEINITQINEAYEDLKKGEIVRSVITSF